MDELKQLIHDGFKLRNKYPGIRLTLRSLIRLAKQRRGEN